MGSPTDHELMERVRRQDARALAELYDRHAPQCLALGERILGDRAEGEDVLQDVFVRVWNEPDGYSPARGSVTAWLIAMMRSRSIDRLRRRGTRQRLAERVAEEQPAYATAPGRCSSTVVQAVQGLPTEQRLTIELAYFEGLTQTEIADRLEQPLGTIKSRLRLGMKKLRQAFEELARLRGTS
jgi:RNA polymerase sigma-70 factor (ECF subfamily)